MAGFAVPIFTAFNLGQVVAGGSVRVYQTLTTTLVNCYADAALTTPITNPITLDQNGETVFYVSGAVNLRLDYYTAAGGFIKSIDPVYPTGLAGTGAVIDQAINLTLAPSNAGNNIIATAPITIALPSTTGFTNSFSVQLNAQSGTITLDPAGSDKINLGTAGAALIMPQGSSGELWTDAVGNWGLNFYTAGTVIPSQITNAVSSLIPGGFINKFRNPLFQIAQRGVAFSIGTGTSAYTFDGWIVGATGATLTVSNGTETKQTTQSIRLEAATGLTDVFIKQRIESFLAAPLIDSTGTADNITVQFRVQNGMAGTITPTLTVKTATATDNWGATTTVVNGVSLQPVTGTYGIVAYTFAAPAGAANGMEITLDFGAQLNAASGSVFITCADIRVTPGVAVGLNNTPPPVEARDIATETALNNRYLCSFGTVVGPVGSGSATSTTASGYLLDFPTPMRIAPTGLTVTTVGDFEVATMASVDTAALTGMTFSKASPVGALVTTTVSSGLTSGVNYFLYAKTALTGNLIFTGAEL